MDKEKTLGKSLIAGLKEVIEYEKGNIELKTSKILSETVTLPNGNLEKVTYMIVSYQTSKNDFFQNFATETELLEYAKANVGLKTPKLSITKHIFDNQNQPANLDEKETMLKIAV
ncbi:MAG: hypothetical protein FWG64_10815 [Firmicutes bacterium]|nr:hypothetical protein [Bacillota bacterium]